MAEGRTNTGVLRIVSLICAGALFLALLSLPIGYYTFLRLLVSVGSVVYVVSNYRRAGRSIWVVLFGILGLLFNPIWPVYLHDRALWVPIDILGGILFLVGGFWPRAGHKT